MRLCACDEEIPEARWALGYRVCTWCGEAHAKKVTERLKTISAPAYNKGCYQPMFTAQDVLDAGRK